MRLHDHREQLVEQYEQPFHGDFLGFVSLDQGEKKPRVVAGAGFWCFVTVLLF